jgi:prolyl-tRNA synthetase
MGSYGIGVERIMTSAIELFHDADGMIWPAAIAPFAVIITPVNFKDEMRAAAEKLYAEMRAAGIDALLDDRTERPGVKFKDADLIGIPLRIVVGDRGLAEGKVEIKRRTDAKPTLVEAGAAVGEALAILGEMKRALGA